MATAVSKRSLLLNEPTFKNINPMVGDMDIQGAIQQAGQAKAQGQRLAALTAQGGPRIGVNPMAQKVYAPAPPMPAPQAMTPPRMNATPGIVPMVSPEPTLTMDLQNNATAQRVNNNLNTRIAENTSRMNNAMSMPSVGERAAFLDQTNPNIAGSEASMSRAKAIGDAVRPTGAYNWIHETPVDTKPQRWVAPSPDTADDRLQRMLRAARLNPDQALSPEEMALNMARFKNTSSVKTQGSTMDSEMKNIAPQIALNRTTAQSKIQYAPRIAEAQVGAMEQANMSPEAYAAKQAATAREYEATAKLPVADQMELSSINTDLPILSAQLTQALTALKDNPSPLVQQQVMDLQKQVNDMMTRKNQIFMAMRAPTPPVSIQPTAAAAPTAPPTIMPSVQPQAPRTPQTQMKNMNNASVYASTIKNDIDTLTNASMDERGFVSAGKSLENILLTLKSADVGTAEELKRIIRNDPKIISWLDWKTPTTEELQQILFGRNTTDGWWSGSYNPINVAGDLLNAI